MKFIKYALIILLLLVVGAYFTNPNEEQHKNKIKSELQLTLTESLSKQGINKDNPLLKSIDTDLFDNLAWGVIGNNIAYQNYHVLSITQVNYSGKTYPMSIGLFGYVFVMPQLKEEVDNRINSVIKAQGGLKELLGF